LVIEGRNYLALCSLRSAKPMPSISPDTPNQKKIVCKEWSQPHGSQSPRSQSPRSSLLARKKVREKVKKKTHGPSKFIGDSLPFVLIEHISNI
jgi:hypothetical protein